MGSDGLHLVFYYHRRLIPFGNEFRFFYTIKYAKFRWGQMVYVGVFYYHRRLIPFGKIFRFLYTIKYAKFRWGQMVYVGFFYYHRRLIPFGNKFRFLYTIKYAKFRWGQMVHVWFFTIIAGWSLLEINSDFCTLLSTLNSDGVRWFTLGFFYYHRRLIPFENKFRFLYSIKYAKFRWGQMVYIGFCYYHRRLIPFENKFRFLYSIKYAKFRWGQMVYIGFFAIIAGWSLLEINSDFCTLLSTLNSDGVKWFTLGFLLSSPVDPFWK